jgi:activating signal cointegrator complex subunit 3
MGEEEISAVAETLVDSALRDTIVFGIGIHHAGLDNSDREAVEALFVEGKIQVLVCTSTLAWYALWHINYFDVHNRLIC